MKKKRSLKSILTFIIGWPLSLIALFFIVKTFSPKVHDLSHNLADLKIPLLLVSVGCFLMYYAIRSIVWNILLIYLGYKIPFIESMALWSISEVKRYIPGNIWSFVGRSVAFTDRGITKNDIAKALIWEQEFVLLASFAVSLLSIGFLARYIFPFLSAIPFLWFWSFCLLFVFTIGYALFVKSHTLLPTRLQKIFQYLLPTLTFSQILILITLSSIGFLFFGFGYYFSIAALVKIEPQLFFALSGFFVFSLVVGLLSFLTPTGLGVREGMITIGLSKLIDIGIAGFASLFGRVILVLSEVLFLVCVTIVAKLHKKARQQIEYFLQTRRFVLLLVFLIVLFVGYFTTISFLRYDNFYTGRFDLGNMDQTVWNTVHGRFFQLTDPNGTETVTRLSFHSDFLLAILAPVYLIWQDPRMLLFIQVVVIACGAFFIYFLSREVLHHEWLSLAFAWCYLLNPSLQRTVIYDFHAVTLATTFLLGAFYFAYKKRYAWFIVFAILSGITKEEVWVIVGLLGLYISFRNGGWKYKNGRITIAKSKEVIFGLLVFGISAGLFYYLLWIAIPQAAKGQHFALSYFSEGSDSPSSLLKSIFLSPQKTLQKVIQQERIEYFRKLLGPVGYLSLAAPWFLIFSGADLTLNILSDKGELHQIYYQYTAAITPFLFIAAIYGVRNCVLLLRRLFTFFHTERLLVFFACYIATITLIGAYLYGPLPGSREPNLVMIQYNGEKAYIDEILDQIDSKYSVAASNALGSHLAQRERIYTLPTGINDADVVAFLLSDQNNQPSQLWHREQSERLLQDPRYHVWFRKDDFIVFKKISSK